MNNMIFKTIKILFYMEYYLDKYLVDEVKVMMVLQIHNVRNNFAGHI